MSLRHALIGLLAEQPASGWDLTRRFEDLLGTVWPAGHPQIYGELRKLEADGFIPLDSEGPRRRKTYRATESGIEVDHTLRLEPVLRSVFFWLMTHERSTARSRRPRTEASTATLRGPNRYESPPRRASGSTKLSATGPPGPWNTNPMCPRVAPAPRSG
jgi:DNA-binding PadR family transcriptional regulator